MTDQLARTFGFYRSTMSMARFVQASNTRDAGDTDHARIPKETLRSSDAPSSQLHIPAIERL